MEAYLRARDISSALLALLRSGATILEAVRDGETIERQGTAFGDSASDTEIRADRVLGEHLRYQIAADGIFGAGRISVEGLDDVLDPSGGSNWVAVDPLDGSLNYRQRCGTIGLPYTACVTVLNRCEGATFGDVIAAAVLDLRSGDAWRAWRDPKRPGQHFTEVNGHCIEATDDPRLDLGSMIVMGEMYYPPNRELLASAFAGQKGWLRNPGSAAYEMACVSNGLAAGFVCGSQKQHELGAGILLVQGAGGVVTDFDGQPLDHRTFDFKTQVPVIMGRTPRLHADLLALVRAAR